MFSLQTIFGKGDTFYTLLEQSAAAAYESASALHELIDTPGRASVNVRFSVAVQREKQLSSQISAALANTFVTALDREDIEALNTALYKIPKTIQRFAERYVLVTERLAGISFVIRTELLLRSTEVVVEIIGQLRRGLKIDPVRQAQERLQALESEGDRLLLVPYRALYMETEDPMRAILTKDLYELLEKAIDRCRDVGNVVYSIVLKNS